MLFSLGLSTLLNLVAVTIAKKYSLVAVTREDRWHKSKVALHGGVAIFFTIIISALISMLFKEWHNPEIVILIAISCACFLGLADDIFHLGAFSKLSTEIIISSVLIFFGVKFQIFEWNFLNIVLTYFWLIGITNALNIIDNMDGLSSGVSLLIISSLFIYKKLFLTSLSNSNVEIILAILFGSIAGFWLLNKKPARIFLGDSGSLMIGMLLASITLATFYPEGSKEFTGDFSYLSFFVIVTLFTYPIFDTIFVSIGRYKAGSPIFQGGTDHSSHKLVILGFTEKQAVLIVYVIQLLGGIVILSIAYFKSVWEMTFITFMMLLLCFGLFLKKKKSQAKCDFELVTKPEENL
ncbi:undecaprenyl/decaprenyl-phosphate alpha-N-acetylglucosaminyl 1-phosphate transferase [Sulfobacillus acidophilus]|uniref:Undecaprenyl/decaprenyl-phosphate alpha-N-acetylglucosaminyl 1-phosphate transferase n=1 Tax=Sulfobacillus acidophilus TaxID=53633 RepID=A0ABS3AWG9_9FIRM|nr:undecaprenyl/decaprenyl-phosphate alpha-N-acetylglucosaminyl 1-phosphate transferase [Sulfobacillus acidophilus]